MKNENLKNGFTLVEMMVVVAIISALAGSVVLGFNSFSEKVKLQEVAGITKDILKKLEMQVFQKEYDQQTVQFKNEFLVIESSQKENPLSLNYAGMGASGCGESEAALEIDPKKNNTLNTAQLRKSDGKGNHLEIKSFSELSTECVSFPESREMEWNFELLTPSSHSKSIRFIHFNINRENLTDPITIKETEDYKLEIKAPYGEKTIYKEGKKVEEIELILQNAEGDEEKLIVK